MSRTATAPWARRLRRPGRGQEAALGKRLVGTAAGLRDPDGDPLGGGAIFFVSNDRSGSLIIRDSFLSQNPSDGFETAGYPGIFVLASGPPVVIGSTIAP